MFRVDINTIRNSVVRDATDVKRMDGKKVAKAVRLQIADYVRNLKKINVQPKLVVIIVGEDPASEIYVRLKIKGCKEVGILSELITFPSDISPDELYTAVDKLSADDSVDGILVQFPVPDHLSETEIVERIAPSKDVDGSHSENLGRLIAWRGEIEPCTPRGIMTLMRVYGIEPRGKRAVVIGRSMVVGRPMAQMLVRADATVTVCHRYTKDLQSFVSQADILVVATGVPHLVPGAWVKPGAAVFDVGITRLDNGKLRGDVNLEECIEHVGKISPVPGGVGPMTVATLLENTIRAATVRRKVNLDMYDTDNDLIKEPERKIMNTDLKHVPLEQKHIDLGGKMVSFAGYLMPIHFTGIKDEHFAVRTNVGLFDVSHMGEVFVRGPGAVAAVDALITNDLSSATTGQAIYTAMCNTEGGIIDDLIVYRMSDEEVLMCVNAGNRDKDFAHISKHISKDVILSDESDDWVQFAIQGPHSEALLAGICSADLSDIRYYTGVYAEVGGFKALVSRTGYTGEDGFEIYAKNEVGESIFDAITEAGKKFNMQNCGLGCRDTLRLEAKYLLYGNDMTEDVNPIEAGLSWVVKLGKKSDFIGKAAIEAIKKAGPTRRLRGFVLQERGVLRPGYSILDGDKKIGELTSGTYSPTLNQSIGLGYVDIGSTKLKEVNIEIRGRHLLAAVTKKAFYQREK